MFRGFFKKHLPGFLVLYINNNKNVNIHLYAKTITKNVNKIWKVSRICKKMYSLIFRLIKYAENDLFSGR